jgi:hypothetical protein
MTRPGGAAGARLAAVAVVLGCLAGCSEPVPEPQPAEDPGPVPVVTEGQLDRVVQQVSTTLAAGDQANSAEAIAPRADGPALELRKARYAVRAAVPGQPAPDALGTERLVDIVPVDAKWPRYVLTVARPAPEAVPRMSLLVQLGVREPYKLTTSATLLPGVTLPRTQAPSEGVESLPPDQKSELPVPPAEVVARYADVLTLGGASQFAPVFADDAFRTAVLAEQDAERTAATATCPGCFSYAATHVPRAGAVWAVRTEDGGALVMGVLDSTRTFTVAAAGAKLPVPADLAALAGRTEATQSAVITSVETVVLHVPAAGNDERTTVVAADRGPVAVAAS